MSHRIWPLSLAVLLLAYATGALLVPPGMFSDSGWGFAVWQSMQHGGPFNWLIQADPTNIAFDGGGFMSWWTPGQYLLPGALTLLGLNLGHALVAVTLAFSALGLVGWYLVYRRFQMGRSIALLSCTVIAVNRFFVLPFGTYNGGEVLLFGGVPYVLLVGLWAFKAPHLRWVPLAGAFLVAFVLKNAALVLALVLCVTLAIRSFREQRVTTALWWPAAFLLSYVTAYALYLSKGLSAASTGRHLADDVIAKTLFALSGPLMSAFSIDESLAWLLANPGRPLWPDWQASLAIMLPLAIVALGAYLLAWRAHRHSEYGRFLPVFLLGYIGIFVVLNVLGSAVSSTTEARHFRPSGMVLLPGVLTLAFTSSRRLVRVAGAMLVIIVGLYGTASYATRLRYLAGRNAVGSQGFTHTIIDRETLHWLAQKDRDLSPGAALFYLTFPEIALEVPHSRVVLTHADFESAELLSSRVYRGTVPHLFVVLPQVFVESGKDRIILSSMHDYSRWNSEQVGQFRIYEGVPQQ